MINRDHSYLEKIVTPRTGEVTIIGRWRWLDGDAVDFDRLWIPPELAPPCVIEADADAAPGRPQYTQPGHWILAPETQFGTVVFEFFPDSGPDLRMVEHY
jgi:hypothetical protein